MCLIVWNWQPALTPRLVLLSNRDEFYARPTAKLHWWKSNSAGDAVLAGKDLQAGGTWLGVSRSGRLAALTNFRSGRALRPDAPSRGKLVADFLQGRMDCQSYLHNLGARADVYNPFNLLVFDGLQFMVLESRGAKVIPLPSGIGGMSNGNLEPPWPKVARLKKNLEIEIGSGAACSTRLLELMHDPIEANDADLPQTGAPMALERALSAIFIATPGYGTRACSMVQISHAKARFVEQCFTQSGFQGTQDISYEITT